MNYNDRLDAHGFLDRTIDPLKPMHSDDKTTGVFWQRSLCYRGDEDFKEHVLHELRATILIRFHDVLQDNRPRVIQIEPIREEMHGPGPSLFGKGLEDTVYVQKMLVFLADAEQAEVGEYVWLPDVPSHFPNYTSPSYKKFTRDRIGWRRVE